MYYDPYEDEPKQIRFLRQDPTGRLNPIDTSEPTTWERIGSVVTMFAVAWAIAVALTIYGRD